MEEVSQNKKTLEDNEKTELKNNDETSTKNEKQPETEEEVENEEELLQNSKDAESDLEEKNDDHILNDELREKTPSPTFAAPSAATLPQVEKEVDVLEQKLNLFLSWCKVNSLTLSPKVTKCSKVMII